MRVKLEHYLASKHRQLLSAAIQEDINIVSRHGGTTKPLNHHIKKVENYSKLWVEVIDNSPLVVLILNPKDAMMDAFIHPKYFTDLSLNERIAVETKMYAFLIEAGKRMKLGYLRMPYYKVGFGTYLPIEREPIELSPLKDYEELIGLKAIMLDPIGIEFRFKGKRDLNQLNETLSTVIPFPFALTYHASMNPINTINIPYDSKNPLYFIQSEPEYNNLVVAIAETIGIEEYEHNPMWYGSLSHKIEEKRWEEFTEEDETKLIDEIFGT